MSQSDSGDQDLNEGLWADFCDHLKRIGDQVMRPEAPRDARTRAEGLRYLTHVLRSSLDIFVDHADPEFPVLYRPCDEIVKYGGDNPDSYYQKAVLSGDKRYRIKGRRGTIPYLSFLTQGTTFSEDKTMVSTGFLDGSSLQIDPDGSFEIIVSVEKSPGNWLPMKPETQALLIRQNFEDRSREQAAELEIECLDAPETPRPLDPVLFEQGLRSSARFVESTVELFCDWAEKWQTHPNQLPKDDQEECQRVGGDPNIIYYNSYWELAGDEALVVELERIPECESWNFEVCNYWYQSLDYRYQRVHVNKSTAKYEDDGSVRIVVAHEDPGHPNWLTTEGHPCGAMLFRWIGAKEHLDPTTRVVKRTDLE